MTDTPELLDLDSILAAAAPRRTLRISAASLKPDVLTLMELHDVGQALGLGPMEIVDVAADKTSWAAFEVGQAIAWVIARRAEPDLTWEEARTYGLELVTEPPDPTRAVAKRPRRRGRNGSSACTG